MKKHRWYCYACGKSIEVEFVIVSMSDRTDKVFLVHEECSKRLDDCVIVKVREVEL